MLHQFEDIAAQKRFTAAENHDPETSLSNLRDHGFRFTGRKFALIALIGVLITVSALQIAAIRGHPRYDHQLLLSRFLIAKKDDIERRNVVVNTKRRGKGKRSQKSHLPRIAN